MVFGLDLYGIIRFFFCLSLKDRIYYYRELLCYLLDKLRIDLVIVSFCYGISFEIEFRFDYNLFFEKDV